MKQLYLLFLLITCLACKSESKTNDVVENVAMNTKVTGPVFGTSFAVTYASEENYVKQFDSLFTVVNQSMSTYIPNSDISRLNKNLDIKLDDHFKRVFEASKQVYSETNGVFDPTIGDVVNAWSFGADKNKFLTDSTTIDSLMKFVGLEKVTWENGRISKPKGTYIEFNAIAKGYAVDVIGEFLESKNISD